MIIRRISNGLEIRLRKIVNTNFDANLSFFGFRAEDSTVSSVLLFLKQSDYIDFSDLTLSRFQ